LMSGRNSDNPTLSRFTPAISRFSLTSVTRSRDRRSQVVDDDLSFEMGHKEKTEHKRFKLA
jgi:hypothetical protein